MTKDTDLKTGLFKTCTKCGSVKELDLFCQGKNRRGEPKRINVCKECERIRTAERRKNPIEREKHREDSRNRMAKLRASDPDWVTKKNKKNRDYAKIKLATDPEHRERVNERRRMLWISNEEYRDQSNERVNAWISANPDRIRSRGSRRRANQLSADGYFTHDDIASINQEQGYECVYCGAETTDNYHVDHINPLSRGGTNWPDNIQILCASCNCSKRDKTDEEYRAILSRRRRLTSRIRPTNPAIVD